MNTEDNGGTASADQGDAEVLEALVEMVELNERYVTCACWLLLCARVSSLSFPPTVDRVKVASGGRPCKPSLCHLSRQIHTLCDGSGNGLFDNGWTPYTLVTPNTTNRTVGWNNRGEFCSSVKLCTSQGVSLGYRYRCRSGHMWLRTKSSFSPTAAFLVACWVQRRYGGDNY